MTKLNAKTILTQGIAGPFSGVGFWGWLVGLPIFMVLALIPVAIAAGFVAGTDYFEQADKVLVFCALLVSLPLIGIFFALMGLGTSLVSLDLASRASAVAILRLAEKTGEPSEER